MHKMGSGFGVKHIQKQEAMIDAEVIDPVDFMKAVAEAEKALHEQWRVYGSPYYQNFPVTIHGTTAVAQPELPLVEEKPDPSIEQDRMWKLLKDIAR
jgi:hypothetical protein